MVFWGAEVKPGVPFTHSGEEDGEYEGSRLHLSQATLGLDGKGKERTVVKCKVGDGKEHLLCSLTPGVSESCSLDLLFDQDVVFSVAGSTSVHLVGYYMPLQDEGDDADYAFDDSKFDSEDDSDDEDYDAYLDDDYDEDSEEESAEDQPRTFVTLQEVDDDGNSVETGMEIENNPPVPPEFRYPVPSHKRTKAEKKAEKENANGSIKQKKRQVEEDSEDEDGFPVPPKKKEVLNISEAAADPLSESNKSKKEKKKEKKKRKKEDKGLTQAAALESPANKAAVENDCQLEVLVSTPAGNENGVSPAKHKSGKKTNPAIRKFPNGLEVQETAMGKPDAKQTKLGKKVSVYYTGRLKSNGKIFDSNIGKKKPFAFRLGVGEVIKGWDVAVAGMRIGDKRTITVPPAMAYGAKGVPGTIPGNSWLVFDVEVTDVGK